MVHVRKQNLADAKEKCLQLKRIGKELQGYGMIGYGGSIITHAEQILNLLPGDDAA